MKKTFLVFMLTISAMLACAVGFSACGSQSNHNSADTGSTSVVIPDNATTIDNYAFHGYKNLTSVVIPDSVTTIGEFAFENCSSLTSVVIPDSVTTIGYHAFEGCSSLTSITFKDTNTWYKTTDSSYTGGTQTSVTNASNNATYFKSTYSAYYWYKL